jgi:hypothetical protein
MKKYLGMMGVVLGFSVTAFALPEGGKIDLYEEPNEVDVDSLCDGAGSLVTNCGFETGTLMGWTQFGDMSYTSVSGGIWANTGNWGLQAGPTPGVGGVYQNVPTTAGQTYALTFYLRNNMTPNSFSVSWNGVVLFSCTNCADFPYTAYGFSGLMATGSTSEVRFAFFNDPNWFGLDDVIVVRCDQ